MTITMVSSSLTNLLQQGRIAQEQWGALTVRQRLGPVQALRRMLAKECDTLCATVARDVGKAAQETIGAEILPLADACRFLEQNAASLLKARRSGMFGRPIWLWGQTDAVHHRPRGVVGVIGTWNYPILLNGVQLVQALTAGNAVLWKPSELAPASALALREMFVRAGYPADLIGLLPATREAGQELADADVDHIVFTGSATVGRALAAHLGKRLVSSTLELSGCDALFVLEDADVELAARAAWFGATLNQGQTCLAVRRAFVQRGVYEPFLRILHQLATSAPPMHLTMSSQVKQAEQLIAEAREQGARLLTSEANGDSENDRHTCQPAIVVDARPEMALCRDASFAPIMAVMPFVSVEECLRMEAHCPFALGAGIFTRDLARAGRLAARLRAGMVAVNDVIAPTAHPATPFGGRGASGWGVTQGAEGLLEMTVPQVVSARSGRFRPHYNMVCGPPGSQEDLVRGLLALCHAINLRDRGRGLLHAAKALWRRRSPIRGQESDRK
jgi:acyl-CoA reductase-like NAD-dependent aldehyde dehydrogenase